MERSRAHNDLCRGGPKAENEVGVVVANWLTEKVVGVERQSDMVMKANVIIRDAVWEVVSFYCYKWGVGWRIV